MTYREIILSLPTPAPNMQIKIELTPSNFNYNNVHIDGNDIKFTETINGTPMSFFKDKWSYNGTSVFYIKVPTQNTSLIYMYYDRIPTTNMSNGASTFDFYEGFDGSIVDTTKWNVYSPLYIKVVNGMLETSTSGSAITSKTNFSRPNILEYDYYVLGTTSRLFHGAHTLTGLNTYEHDFANQTGANLIARANVGSVIQNIGMYSGNIMYNVRFVLKPTGTDYYVNGGTYSFTSPVYSENTNINSFKFGLYQMDLVAGTPYAYFDNIRVRKYPDIPTTVGNEVGGTCVPVTCSLTII